MTPAASPAAVAPTGFRPRAGMVLAAGLGTRMRPITETMPKPLVEVAGRALLDRALDRLAEQGVEVAVVNVHHLADQVEAHVSGRDRPPVRISDERAALLDTGGGVTRALPLLGAEPFFLLNADSFWAERGTSNLAALAAAWGTQMDGLLLLAPRETAVGYEGSGDFLLDAAGRVLRRPPGGTAPFVYTGVAIVDPAALFAAAPAGPFSLNLVIDQAMRAGRLYGQVIDGLWLHVGTPGAIGEAERALAAYAG